MKHRRGGELRLGDQVQGVSLSKSLKDEPEWTRLGGGEVRRGW